MDNSTETKPSIQVIRNQRVMLSTELASLYGVSPSVLMQAVKRNLLRFPHDFMFQLKFEEWANLKSQFVISNKASVGRGGARTAPYAFTEQGVAMLSSVLKSERAINVNIEIMRAFVKLRRLVTEHQDLTLRLDDLEDHYDNQFKAVFDAIRALMQAPKPEKHPIGFTAEFKTKKIKNKKMKILVIGSGGREHALAWKIAQNKEVSRVYVAPGNAGTALDLDMVNVPISSVEDLLAFAIKEQIYLTIVGPEAPLSQGVVDVFRANSLKIFGPKQAAAQLESSKDFAKAFMLRHNIPTAAYATFTDVQRAHDYVKLQGAPIVIKADGLAAGKGVVVAMSNDEAHAAIDAMLSDNKLGDAGARVVIEEFLTGEEASFIVMVDGKNILALATSQDHKRLIDGDLGPNTGGMGAYSPAPIVTPEIHAKVMREIIRPTVDGMAKDGIPYTGFLYAGLMISPNGDVKTLEFNCRMGDPETQPIMMRLKSDFVELAEHAINGTLDLAQPIWDRRTALGVVMASQNYPDTPRLNDEITGLPKHIDDGYVFHAGTKLVDGKVLTNGGRVLCVAALGETVKFAQQQAYKIAETIHFDGAQYRTDIGYRAIKG